jgi:hypothetical protein
MAKSIGRVSGWMTGPLRKLLDCDLESQIRSIAGLVPVSETSAQDIFICGYPKSGNTWFQNLIAGVVYGADAAMLPDYFVQEMCPDLQARRYYRRYGTPMYFKSHELPRPEYRRVVHLLRDGRDATVSYFHHLCAISGKELDFLHLIRTADGMQNRWHEHTEAWLDNPFQSEMIQMKYEELKSDGVRALRRFCDFVGLERSDEVLKRALDDSNFEKMRNKEITQGWSTPSWPKDKPFVRRGVVGSFRDEMPAAALELFMKDAGPTLKKCGYLEPEH